MFYTDLSGQQVGDHLFDCTYIPSPRLKSLGESVSINNGVLIVLECHFTVFGQDWWKSVSGNQKTPKSSCQEISWRESSVFSYHSKSTIQFRRKDRERSCGSSSSSQVGVAKKACKPPEQGCSRSKVPLLGLSLGPRSCRSVFLPNDLSLDDWYAGVYALPTVWPDVSMMGANNLRRVVGYDFHHIRKKYGDCCSSTWKPRGLVGTRLQKEKNGSLPTDLIGLEMI